MVSEQKIVFWVVGPKFFQDSEVCFMVRGQVNSGEEKVMSIYSGDVSGDVYGDQAAPPPEGQSGKRNKFTAYSSPL